VSCDRPKGAIDAVSCATPSLCVAVAKGGQVFVSGDPTGGASAWRAPGGRGRSSSSPRASGNPALPAIGRTGLRGPGTALRFTVQHPHRR